MGTALVRAVEERFAGVRRFELFTGNRSEANIRLYRRLGYREYPTTGAHPDLIYLEKVVAVVP